MRIQRWLSTVLAIVIILVFTVLGLVIWPVRKVWKKIFRE